MKTLFVEKTTYRRSNGQFATKEMAYADKQAKENAILRFELEKYKRAYSSLAKRFVETERKINQIKELLK